MAQFERIPARALGSVRVGATTLFLLLGVVACGGSAAIARDHTRGVAELRRVGLPAPVLSVAWSPDTKRISAGAADGVYAVDPRTGRVRRVLRTRSQVWGVAWKRDGSALAAATADGRVWVLRSRAGRRRVSVLRRRFGAPAFSVAWSATGELAVGYASGTVRVIGGGEDRARRAHDAEVITVAWTHSGERLASGSIDTKIQLDDSSFGDPEGADVNGLAWAPDDVRLAAANQDGQVRVWDSKTGTLEARLRGHVGWVRGIDWSPNGQLLASSGADGSVRLWNPDSGRLLRRLRTGSGEAWSVAWSSDGAQLAAGNGDGSVSVWGPRE